MGKGKEIDKKLIEQAIKELASKKKIFSNEFQFQFDLAWEID